MKRMKKLTLLVVLATSVVCCEQIENDMNDVNSLKKNELVENALVFGAYGKTHIVIRCDNSCQDMMASCQAFYTSQKVFRCQCAGCVMVVEERPGFGFSKRASEEHSKIAMEILNDEVFYQLLVETVEEKYSGEDFMVSEFHTIFTDDKIFIQYHYSTIKDNVGTLSIEIESKNGPTKKFMCTGTCESKEVCRETYSPSTGDFDCDGCEECKGSKTPQMYRPEILSDF